MNAPSNGPAPSAAGCGLRFVVGQAVEVKQGVLAGISGVLIGFSSEHHCLIELNIVQRGVVLVIDRAAVKATNATPAEPGVCD